jgi:hypothetical protein
VLPHAVIRKNTTLQNTKSPPKVSYRRALNRMIALDLAVASRCRHVRRVMVMMMAMGQLGHEDNNLA